MEEEVYKEMVKTERRSHFAMIFSGQRVSVISSLCEYDPLKCEYSQKKIQEAELHSLSYLYDRTRSGNSGN